MFRQTHNRKHKSTVIATIALLLLILNYAKIDEASIATPESLMVVGQASWYSQESPGINPRTANNEIFDDSDMTCAIWNIPFHKRIKVTNLDNGRSIVVRVNDRGPHNRFVNRGRVIDLTKSAFNKLSPLNKGLIRVSLELL